MVMTYQTGNKVSYDASVYLVDTRDDLATVPDTQMGSVAYVIQTGDVWVMGSDTTWYPVNSAAGAPVVCDCVDESTIWANIPGGGR